MKAVILLFSFITSIAPNLASEKGISGLAWLEGHWKGSFEGMEYEEIYTGDEGRRILWMSKMYLDGEVIFFEFGTIEQQNDAIFYTPYPNGTKSNRFRLVELDPGEKAVFENDANTFPTRFIFDHGNGELEITLKGPKGTEDRTQKVELERVP